MNSDNYIMLFLLLFLFSIGCSDEKPSQPKKYQLVWSDEFNYDGLPDSTKWGYDIGNGCELPCGCGWGNNEYQYYMGKELKNARVGDGKLTIEVHKEDIGNAKYSSARLVTRGKSDWKYGRFEIKAKLPTGRGIWSALWMLPTDNTYGIWPHSGEIDIMENVGFDPDTIEASAHTLDYHFTNKTQKHARTYLPSSDRTFHKYALEWEADEYRVYMWMIGPISFLKMKTRAMRYGLLINPFISF